MLIIAAARQPTLARFHATTPYPLVMSQYWNLRTRHPRALNALTRLLAQAPSAR